MELNKIYNCDCLEFMKTLPDKCIDLCLTDPPYGIGIDGQKEQYCKNPKHNRKKHDFKGWDNVIPSIEVFKEIFRVSKNQIIWGGNYFVEYLESHKCWLYWDKGQDGLTMSDGELAYTSFDTPLRAIKINRCELIKDNTKHPTQKPLRLGTWILEKYAKEGDIIFDPFAGSGTFLVSAQNLGFKYIGCELDKDYFEIAEKRLGFIKQRLF